MMPRSFDFTFVGDDGFDLLIGTRFRDKLLGQGGPDILIGRLGADGLDGGPGPDLVLGGRGADALRGGAGSDAVFAGPGDDLLGYVAADNVGATDVYNGGGGTDTLGLAVTADIWQDTAFQADLATAEAFIAAETGPGGTASDAVYTFTTLGLSFSQIEDIQVKVTGQVAPPFGIVLNGAEFGRFSGASVASAGDVNGDGIADVIIGAGGGTAYVGFGRNGASFDTVPTSFDLGSLNGRNGLTLTFDEPNPGTSIVSSAGDLNGDGVGDVLVSSSRDDAFVIFGRDTDAEGDFPATLDVSTLDGTNGFAIEANGAVSSIGDLDGDGIDDITLDGGVVIFGKDTAADGDFDPLITVSSLDGSNGFVVEGALMV